MDNVDIIVDLRIKSRLIKDQMRVLLPPQNGFQILENADDTIVDLMVFELTEDYENEFVQLQSLIDSGLVKETFLVADKPDTDILLKALKVGAREFFNFPVNEKEFSQALDKFISRRSRSMQTEPLQVGRLYTFIGSKGGTGTTTVAVNLSTSLSKNHKVALVDMNQLFGEIPHFLDIKAKYSWGEITKNISRLDSTFLENIFTIDKSGVYVLPSPGYLTHETLTTPEIIERLLRVMRSMFDFVIVDAGQLLDEVGLKIINLSDSVFIVSIMSIPCLANTNKLLKTFYDLGYPTKEDVKIIINRYMKKGSIAMEDAEKAVDHKIFWTIPNDYPSTVSAINNGKPLIKIAPKAPITKNFESLADTLTAPIEKVEKKKRWRLFSSGK